MMVESARIVSVSPFFAFAFTPFTTPPSMMNSVAGVLVMISPPLSLMRFANSCTRTVPWPPLYMCQVRLPSMKAVFTAS